MKYDKVDDNSPVGAVTCVLQTDGMADSESEGSRDGSGANKALLPPSPSISEGSLSHTHAGATDNGTQDSDDSSDIPLDFSMKRPKLEPNEDDIDIKPINGRDILSNSSKISSSNGPNAEVDVKALTQHLNTLRSFVNGVANQKDNVEKSRKHSPEPGLDRIGEPQTALPGTIPGTLLPGMGALSGLPPAMAAMLPNAGMFGSFPFLLDPSRAQNTNNSNNSKSSRPFKAYPKDPLSLPLGYYGIPGMLPVGGLDPAAAQAMTMSSEEIFNQYRNYVIKAKEETLKRSGGLPSLGSLHDATESAAAVQVGTASTTTAAVSTSSTASPSTSASSVSGAASPPSFSSLSTTPPTATPTSISSTTPTPTRKRGRAFPDEKKDDSYWERRRKNNEAAKRSRDSRRAKEDEIAIRAALLEQENLKLRVEVAALKNETAKLRCMLYNS